MRVHDISKLARINEERALNLEQSLRRRGDRKQTGKLVEEALDNLDEKGMKELQEVLIPSSDVGFKQMLGRGGNGEVFIGVYKDTKIAVKRMITIDEASLERFRFECFMMKELRHPNIVRLVGVCWDVNLVACCLEYIDNGTLEEWLRIDARRREKKMNGKDVVEIPENSQRRRASFEEALNLPFDKAIYTGWKPPPLSNYLPADVAKIKQCEERIRAVWKSCTKEEDGWSRLNIDAITSNLEGFNPDTDNEHFQTYARLGGGHRGEWEAFITFEVNMRPDQWMAGQMHADNAPETEDYQWLHPRNMHGYRNIYRSMVRVPFLQTRESIYVGMGAALDDGIYITAATSCEHDDHPVSNPDFTRVDLLDCGQMFLPIQNDDGETVKTLVIRYNVANLFLPGLISIVGDNYFTKRSAEQISISPWEQKRIVEKTLENYRPTLPNGLLWKEHLFNIFFETAGVFQYLHESARYYSEEDRAYRDCIIHRDLKPDNMLLTKNFSVKVADFGESRSAHERVTMSFVGTPLYIAPEIVRAEQYDKKCDTFSFGMALVASIRAEKNLFTFLIESLRKDIGKRSRFGMSMFMLNHKMLNKKWRPRLPRRFVRAYPQLDKLIRDCWQDDPELRPDFDEIVRRMNDVRLEVVSSPEPDVKLLSEEEDGLYHERESRITMAELQRKKSKQFADDVAAEMQHYAMESSESFGLTPPTEGNSYTNSSSNEGSNNRSSTQSSTSLIYSGPSEDAASIVVRKLNFKGDESISDLTTMLQKQKTIARKIAEETSIVNLNIDNIKDLLSEHFNIHGGDNDDKDSAEYESNQKYGSQRLSRRLSRTSRDKFERSRSREKSKNESDDKSSTSNTSSRMDSEKRSQSLRR